jgi:hypothetical protein
MSKKKKIKKEFFSILIVTSLIAFSPIIGQAQDGGSEQQKVQPSPYSIETLQDTGEFRDFVVGPGKKELVLNPGESVTVKLTVTNRMGDERIFRIETEDFAGSQDVNQTVVLLGDERGPYSLKNYIKVPAQEFTLKHGERATIPVTVSIPFDEEPGGKYGSLVVSTESKDVDRPVGTAATAIIARIGTLFFVTVPGDIDKNGILESFKTKSGKRIFVGGPIDFEILFRNLGSVHLNPYGEVRIKNILGKEVGMQELDPWFTMPSSLRLREISWNRNWLFGAYTASAYINRGYGDIIDEAGYTFFVLPWKPIILVLAVLFVLIMFLRFIFKRFEFKRKTND